MQRNALFRTAAVAAAAVMSFGVAGPSASAAPQDRAGQVSTERTGAKAGNAGKAEVRAARKAGSGKKAGRTKEDRKHAKAARAQKRKQAAFAATLKKVDVAGLPQDVRDLLAESVASDREALAEARGKELREFNPSSYVRAINYLRQAARMQAEVDFNAALLAELMAAPQEPAPGDTPADPAPEESPSEGPGTEAPSQEPVLTEPGVVATSEPVDLAAAVAANDQASAAIASAVVKALAITGTSSKDEVKAVKEDLEAAEDALDEVEDILEEYLEGDDEDEDDEDEVDEEDEDESDEDESDD